MSEDRRAQCANELKHLLSTQFDQLKSMNDYFAELKSAIVENELEQINELLADNTITTSAIAEFDNNRNLLLAEFGFEQSPDGFESCLDACDQDAQLLEQYQLFIDELKTLQKSIQVGRLLTIKSQDHVRRSLQTLIGNNRNTSMTYACDGAANHSSDQRSIAQA